MSQLYFEFITMYNVTSNILIILWFERYLHVVEYKSIQQKIKTYLGLGVI